MPIREIPREEWASFFDSFNRQHQGWLVSTEMLDHEIDHLIEARELPLEGITPKLGDGADQLEIAVGRTTKAHLSHTVNSPTRVYLQQTVQGADELLQIRSSSGTLVLRFRSAVLPEMVDGL